MNLLLTSSGVSNLTIESALVALLGKPIAECTALVVPTGIYPFGVGPEMAARLIRGEVSGPLCELGWKSLGVLELTALPSLDQAVWSRTVQDADALLVWGGDPLYLSHWIWQSGLADLLPALRPEAVYVGVSAGAMAAAATLGETYSEAPRTSASPLTCEEIAFPIPGGEITRTFVTARGAGLVAFAVIPHLDHPDHPDASRANAATWAARLPVPTYAIDDETAITVSGGVVSVVSEGHWELFTP